MDEYCSKCANKDTEYCWICLEHDMYRTKEQKEYEEYMRNLMCGYD